MDRVLVIAPGDANHLGGGEKGKRRGPSPWRRKAPISMVDLKNCNCNLLPWAAASSADSISPPPHRNSTLPRSRRSGQARSGRETRGSALPRALQRVHTDERDAQATPAPLHGDLVLAREPPERHQGGLGIETRLLAHLGQLGRATFLLDCLPDLSCSTTDPIDHHDHSPPQRGEWPGPLGREAIRPSNRNLRQNGARAPAHDPLARWARTGRKRQGSQVSMPPASGSTARRCWRCRRAP